MNESLNVLIVDDDVSIQNVVEEILSDGGFEPKAASSGEEAIALLNAHKFRAVIIDISFGKDHVKGWAVARRARAFNPALPIIQIFIRQNCLRSSNNNRLLTIWDAFYPNGQWRFEFRL